MRPSPVHSVYQSVIGSTYLALFRNLRLTTEVMVRLVADTLMVASTLLAGLLLRLFWLIQVQQSPKPPYELVAEFTQAYMSSLAALLPISLCVFIVSGFYTRGRAYRGRYKALVIAQAVTLSYLLFSLLAFFLPDAIPIPRGSLVPAWLLTMSCLIGARVWTQVWSTVAQIEQHLYGLDDSDAKIRSVLVIGGAGYIGSALLPKLLGKGYHVRLLDLLLFGTEPISDVAAHPNLEIVRADFRHVDKVVEAMRGMDAVIHLGAIVGDPACALDEKLTIEVNLMATRMIAEVAKGSGIKRFIFASTCSVYGASDEVLNERSELNPVSLYARSKIASEKVLEKLADATFCPTILRFGTIYGLSGRTRFDLVVNLLTAKALVEGEITVYGGDQWRPFVHVDDAALAVFKVLEAPLALVRDEIFNVGSDDQNYTLQQAAEIVNRRVPEARLLSMGMDGDRRNYRVDFSKIRDFLGFMPQHSVEQGVDQVIEAIRVGKVKDYHEAKYSNVKFLSGEGLLHLIQPENGWVYDLLNESAAHREHSMDHAHSRGNHTPDSRTILVANPA